MAAMHLGIVLTGSEFVLLQPFGGNGFHDFAHFGNFIEKGPEGRGVEHKKIAVTKGNDFGGARAVGQGGDLAKEITATQQETLVAGQDLD